MQPTIQVVSGLLRYCLVGFIALGLLAGCGGGPPEDLLDRISGTWETDAPGYERARIEISREKVIFHAVDDSVSVNQIADIRHTTDKIGDLLTIEYKNRYKQKYLLNVYLLATPDGDTLVKKNQQHIVWKKPPGRP